MSGGVSASAGPKQDNWATLKSERHGYAITYPADVFAQQQLPASEDGLVFTSKDGKAKLLVGTVTNDGNTTLAEYRDFLLAEHYAKAIIDYAPVKRRWFVLSGTRDGETFYQRVMFTCGGKLITSWAMLYPAAESKLYDRVVEAVAPTFSPGAGRAGDCN